MANLIAHIYTKIKCFLYGQFRGMNHRKIARSPWRVREGFSVWAEMALAAPSFARSPLPRARTAKPPPPAWLRCMSSPENNLKSATASGTTPIVCRSPMASVQNIVLAFLYTSASIRTLTTNSLPSAHPFHLLGRGRFHPL